MEISVILSKDTIDMEVKLRDAPSGVQLGIVFGVHEITRPPHVNSGDKKRKFIPKFAEISVNFNGNRNLKVGRNFEQTNSRKKNRNRN